MRDSRSVPKNALDGNLCGLAKLQAQDGERAIVVSVITLDAVKGLQLKVGDHAYAVIKASSVMIAVD